MSHYGNDDRFDHIFFYDSDDFLSSNKKILASQLEQFAALISPINIIFHILLQQMRIC